ncbi:hypothetical protein [Frankia sp. Cr1]|uniref:hypothetical protein n=1 Tax=Frankia sp. Cr1 TaxID=3073931 RepID=UPI002AD4BA47|nr:hypothetical protein [Frankia sp. Cr1]
MKGRQPPASAFASLAVWLGGSEIWTAARETAMTWSMRLVICMAVGIPAGLAVIKFDILGYVLNSVFRLVESVVSRWHRLRRYRHDQLTVAVWK